MVKVGSGRWTVSKKIDSFKDVRVNGGMLYLNSSSEDVLFPSLMINVADSGMVGGKGYLKDIVLYEGATLRPGIEQSTFRYEALKVKGSIIMNSGSHLQLFVIKSRGGNNDHSWIEAADLTLDGDVTLEAYFDYIPALGDEIMLWQVNRFSGTPSAIHLPELPAGLAWDTSDLLKPTGIVRVVEGTGINQIANNQPFEGTVYTLAGVKVGDIVTTKATMQKDIKEMGVEGGVYLIRTATGNVKVTVK